MGVRTDRQTDREKGSYLVTERHHCETAYIHAHIDTQITSGHSLKFSLQVIFVQCYHLVTCQGGYVTTLH